LLELNSNFNDIIFEGCDIYPKDAKCYFQSYSDMSHLNIYDAISSNAVIEHLGDTINSWKYLNRLLKASNEGGGIMIHAFPSQITEDYLHWTIEIRSHKCLFSKKSLSLIVRKQVLN
jgi:cyclopropane fatty-acyl-phospholipid synthase-like methyltransferase